MKSINKDTIAEEDLLNRKPFAKEIVKSLILSFENDTNSFVFGLNGKWGCGKSTLLGFIKSLLQKELQEQKDYIFIDFNPWKFSTDDNLLNSFLNLFLRGNNSVKNRFRKWAKTGSKFSILLYPLKYVIPGADDIQQSLSDKLSEFSGDPTNNDLKSDVDKLIVEKGLKIYVFVDDLDRLNPKEIVEVFQIIKMNASFKNTVFIVAYDKDVVQNALSNEYKLDGEKYLDKIIQVDYRVPDPLEEDIERIFLGICKEFFTSTDIAFDEDEIKTLWTVFRLKHYFHTLRDVHRYFNALKTRLPAIKDDINLRDFLAIEAIRIFDYSAYEMIQVYYKADIQANRTFEILQNVKANLTTSTLADYIFNSRNNKNTPLSISKSKYFSRYFALAVGRNDHMEAIVRHFVKSPDNRSVIFDQCIEDGTAKELLVRLRDEDLDLELLRVITSWKQYKEPEFVNCVDDLLIVINKIIQQQIAPAQGIAFLIEIISQDDGNFNAGKFYLLYYFNVVLRKGEATELLDYIEIINAFKSELQVKEIELLKKHENDHLTFTPRWDHKSGFIHKIFVEEYARLLSHEYEKKAKAYVSRREGLLVYIRFLFKVNLDNQFYIDEDGAKKILTKELFAHLRLESLKIDPSSLYGRDLQIFELFQTLKPKIQLMITGKNK